MFDTGGQVLLTPCPNSTMKTYRPVSGLTLSLISSTHSMLTAERLRTLLKQRGLKTSGRKQELADRMTEWWLDHNGFYCPDAEPQHEPVE